MFVLDAILKHGIARAARSRRLHLIIGNHSKTLKGNRVARRRKGRFGAYDIARMRGEFGWRPRPLRDAMRDYIAWLKENEFEA